MVSVINWIDAGWSVYGTIPGVRSITDGKHAIRVTIPAVYGAWRCWASTPIVEIGTSARKPGVSFKAVIPGRRRLVGSTTPRHVYATLVTKIIYDLTIGQGADIIPNIPVYPNYQFQPLIGRGVNGSDNLHCIRVPRRHC